VSSTSIKNGQRAQQLGSKDRLIGAKSMGLDILENLGCPSKKKKKNLVAKWPRHCQSLHHFSSLKQSPKMKLLGILLAFSHPCLIVAFFFFCCCCCCL
jgi:hypothetical protein